MYLPASNTEHDRAIMFDFIEAHPLGALVTASADGLFATHLPLLVDRSRGAHGTLQGHVARANAHSRQPADAREALVIFSGPTAYVSPTWYPAKALHGQVVPTWNYVAIHVYGTLRFLDDQQFLHRHLAELTALHESGREAPWAPSDAPADYIAGMERAIVGVELTITRMEGKWKMSQNRSAADIDGVVHGLEQSSSATDREVAAIVDARRPHDDGAR